MRDHWRIVLVVLVVLAGGGLAWQILFGSSDAQQIVVTAADGAEAALVPAALLAVTVKV